MLISPAACVTTMHEPQVQSMSVTKGTVPGTVSCVRLRHFWQPNWSFMPYVIGRMAENFSRR
jgi:hypothetical protein